MIIVKKNINAVKENTSDLEFASYITGHTLNIQVKAYTNLYDEPTAGYARSLKFTQGYRQAFVLANQVRYFQKLNANWDSYNADPVDPTAITIAMQVVDRLSVDGHLSTGIAVHVFPMRDGGIQFEFDGKGLSAELEIAPTGELTFIEYDEEGDLVEEIAHFHLTSLESSLIGLEYA